MDETTGLSKHDHAACVVHALTTAVRVCDQEALRFTPVRRRALEILLESHTALGAYDVLARLDREGLGSTPPIAYRALGFLVEHGFAHRIERLNAFIACNRPDVRHTPAFMICTGCRAVGEAHASPMRGALGRVARDAGFRIDSTTLEVEGLCGACRPESDR